MPSRSSVLSSASTTRIPTAAQDTAAPLRRARSGLTASVVCEGVVGGVVAAHAVDAAAGRRGRGAQEQARVRTCGTGGRPGAGAAAAAGRRGSRRRCRRRRCSRCSASNQLLSADVPGQHDVAEARCEALDLALDGLGHVDRGARRHVAVGPQRVLARRRPGGVEEALLADQHERSRGVAARRRPRPPPRRSRAACRRGAAIPPCRASGFVHGHRLGQRVVHLEHAGPVAERAAAVAGTRLGSASPQIRSSWRGVTSNSTARESGTSASDRTGRPVSISPPSSAMRAGHGVGDALASRHAPPASRPRGPRRGA